MRSWKTTLSAVMTVLAGFVLFSPNTFKEWPIVIEVAKYIAAGGVLSLGISSKDYNVTGPDSPPSKDVATK